MVLVEGKKKVLVRKGYKSEKKGRRSWETVDRSGQKLIQEGIKKVGERTARWESVSRSRSAARLT